MTSTVSYFMIADEVLGQWTKALSCFAYGQLVPGFHTFGLSLRPYCSLSRRPWSLVSAMGACSACFYGVPYALGRVFPSVFWIQLAYTLGHIYMYAPFCLLL
jgi:hypothetical protein